MKTILAMFLALAMMLMITSCGNSDENSGRESTTHEHLWSNATCVVPKTCLVCKIVEGELGDHNYIDGICSFCQGKDPLFATEWNLEGSVLTISGTGAMEDYITFFVTPWNEQAESVKTIIIKDGVTHIGNYAFVDCVNVENVEIAGTVTSIGENAFYGCKKLTDVVIPESVTSIGQMAFCNCERLENVNIPKGVTRIEAHTFKSTRLSSVELPEGLLSIGEGAFFWSNLTEIKLPDTLVSIEESAFSFNDFTTVVIPGSVKEISDEAFFSCDLLSNIVFNEGITSIGYQSFYGCRIESVAIPASVVSIDKYAFEYCYQLETIYGAAGSCAETFAKEQNYSFVAQ